MWWHHVRSLAPFNVLVNYWWRRSPAWLGSPLSALHHAMWAVRDLPAREKQAWQGLFQYYVFGPGARRSSLMPRAGSGTVRRAARACARCCWAGSTVEKERHSGYREHPAGRIRKVVIAGGGTAGWLAGCALAHQFRDQLEITLVESEQIGTVGVGESTVPPIRTFHRFLQIDEQEFLRAVAGTFKLSISFENWRLPGDRFFHPFGTIGHGTWAAPFHHFWLDSLRRGMPSDLGDFCLESIASRATAFRCDPAAGQLRLPLRCRALCAVPAPQGRGPRPAPDRRQDRPGPAACA